MTNSISIKPSKVIQLGHSTLRKVAAPVEDITHNTTQQLIENMLVTVKEAGGVGIAAPQINVSQRIFIMCSKPNNRYPDAPLMEPTAIINPKILSKSTDTEKDWEGCLSVPAIRGLVPRYRSIQVEYYDKEGVKHNSHYSGFIARIFQHELDHLDGITFVDRVESTRDLFSEEEWRKQIAN